MSFIPEVKVDFIPSEDEDEIAENKPHEEGTYEEAENLKVDTDSDEEIVEQVKEVIFEKKQKPKKEPKLNKNGTERKKRPPMSEEHKKKLQLAREKAMAVRKAKAEEKKKDKQLEKEEKELLKKQKVKRVQKLKQEVEEDEPPKQEKKIEPKYPTSTITKKDLEDAQLEAIVKYEKIRKQRKLEKQERLKKEKEEQNIRETLMRAVNPPKEHNPFAGCY